MPALSTLDADQVASEKSTEGAAAILDAATQLFADKGFDAVPLSAIAERAGVSKGNIFYHFGSKELLYTAVIRQACDRTARLLHEVTTRTGSFAERVRHFATAHLRNLMSDPTLSRLILRELMEGDARRGSTQVEKIMGANFEKLVDIFRMGQKQGVVKQDLDPAVLALALVAGNVFFFQVRSMLPHFPDARSIDNADYYSKVVADVFLNGVLVQERPSMGGQSNARDC